MILVTGGTGLVGAHLLYHLTKENTIVKAIYRSEDKLDAVKKVFSFYTDDIVTHFEKIVWIKADITDISSLNNVFSSSITHVYHCAALVSFNPKEYYKMRKVNIEGTANIVNFCIDAKVKKLCHVSSIATLGTAIAENPVTEENERSEHQNQCGYSITKYGAETEVWRASQEGIDVIIVNPGVILGSGFYKDGSGKIFDQVHKGLRFYTEGITGFVSVKDVVNTMILLMKSDVINERFIVVAENKSFKDVLSLIATHFNKKPPKTKMGSFLLHAFWRVDTLLTKITNKKPLLSRSSTKAALNKTNYSAEKLTKQLDYTFESLEKTIKECCSNYFS